MPALEKIVEGSTKLVVPGYAKELGPAAKSTIFYNPAMRANRDITVLFARAVAKNGWTVLDALGGTGAKGIRLVVETGLELDITVNDSSKDAFGTIKKNIRANKLKNVRASNQEYNALLSNCGYDWIEIDPYGSPVRFMDLAFRRVSRNGIISITATDTAPLCGTRTDTCRRRYLARPMRGPCAHEFGLRILVGNAVRRAAVFDFGLVPMLAYYHGHYFRAFFRKLKGVKLANSALEGLGYVTWDEKKGYTVTGEEPVRGTFAGPLWTGDLWDKDTVNRMLESLDDDIGREAVKVLRSIDGELLQPPYYHHIDHLASMTGTDPVGTDRLIQHLGEVGFASSGVHYTRKGFKTNASLPEIKTILSELSQ
ncbi:MAG: tRNA (guanine(26)-N(2))-dimethyltransferase [Candidatus Thermoplasmatota archaeon]|nr:hypothetical protein [Euryarchaeota archaeon]MBU4032621.1 tRNA (guanine(26)-N(2))-dimethyltransferase [Candidatus Thermoplasmatota archaeon]MBU4071407.1 tRNA (guanine(26)-N(2))-dimethyltransferase [Candidatus Thermoplasmatota archaeon]MBU4144899.1 tRNA (guanine(26)-N(2))-dimethyltransferase [Candidatus Thermoplasmatota archaeon]MBU4592392.1 tRNA (guanine(26)-N(2))-dimethyltransferase [Candidatus Thermoplasmatota archaeon]